MAEVTLLGSSATIADHESDSIYLAVESVEGNFLIDCGGSPSYRLAKANIELNQVRGVLLTHDHSDHIYGLPLLVQTLMLLKWVDQWNGALQLWGLESTLATAKKLLDVFELPDRIPLQFNPISAKAEQLALETADLRILTSPVQHSRPNIAVRVEGKGSGRVLVYSSDTEPCPAVTALATGADILLYESTVMEPMPGHSTPEQAGQVAAAAGVKQLVLVHFDPTKKHRMPAVAAKFFGGRVELGQDFMEFEL